MTDEQKIKLYDYVSDKLLIYEEAYKMACEVLYDINCRINNTEIDFEEYFIKKSKRGVKNMNLKIILDELKELRRYLVINGELSHVNYNVINRLDAIINEWALANSLPDLKVDKSMIDEIVEMIENQKKTLQDFLENKKEM